MHDITSFVAFLSEQSPTQIASDRFFESARGFRIRTDEVYKCILRNAPSHSSFFSIGGEIENQKKGQERIEQLVKGESITGLAELSKSSTLIVRSANQYFPELGEIVEDGKRCIQGTVHSNLYLSSSHGEGFPMHQDAHHVFALQLHGAKRWHLQRPAVEYPHWDYRWDLDIDENLVEQEFLVEEGSTLFIPMGWIHRAKAETEFSIHATIGFNPLRYSDAICHYIRQRAGQLSILRKPVLLSNKTTAQSPTDYVSSDSEIRSLLELLMLDLDAN